MICSLHVTRALFIVAEDHGSNVSQLCHELRRTGSVDARCLVLQPEPGRLMGGDIRIEHDGGAEFMRLLAGADVVQLVDVDAEAETLGDRTLKEALQGHRVFGHIRRATAAVGAGLQVLAEQHGGALLCEGPARARQLGAIFVPPFMPTWRGIYQPVPPGTRGRADLSRKATVHVSSMQPLKRRPRLEDLVDRVELEAPASVRVDTTVCERQARVMRRRRHALLCLGAWDDGIGRGGLEALCQGVPLVAEVDMASVEVYAEIAGAPPPIHTAAALEELVHRLDARADSDTASAAWSRRLLDPSVTVARILSAWAC